GTWGGRPPRPQGRGGRGGVRPRAVGVRVGCGGGGAPWGEGPRPARRSRPGSGGGLRGRRRRRSAVRSLREGRWRMLTFLLVVLAGGCDFPGKPREADRPLPPDQGKGFDALYGVRCAGRPRGHGNPRPPPAVERPRLPRHGPRWGVAARPRGGAGGEPRAAEPDAGFRPRPGWPADRRSGPGAGRRDQEARGPGCVRGGATAVPQPGW